MLFYGIRLLHTAYSIEYIWCSICNISCSLLHCCHMPTMHVYFSKQSPVIIHGSYCGQGQDECIALWDATLHAVCSVVHATFCQMEYIIQYSVHTYILYSAHNIHIAHCRIVCIYDTMRPHHQQDTISRHEKVSIFHLFCRHPATGSLASP